MQHLPGGLEAIVSEVIRTVVRAGSLETRGSEEDVKMEREVDGQKARREEVVIICVGAGV